MTDRLHRRAALVCLSLLVPGAAAAQSADSLADRPLATRAELERLVARLRDDAGRQEVLQRVRSRLTLGDFRPGDLILLQVQGESTLTDTFAVRATGDLVLPSPVVGALPLGGVLRAELQDTLTRFLSRFLATPVVAAQALIRLSIQGEVAHAGIYGVPADARLSDALMAAGGTTQRADLRKLRLERDGDRRWSGKTVDVPIDRLGVRDGDQLVVGGRHSGAFNENLRFLWLLVSITGGIYGLSRAIH